jgi:hypothetical protein
MIASDDICMEWRQWFQDIIRDSPEVVRELKKICQDSQ